MPGKKNESAKKLLVKPVEIVVAPATWERVTLMETVPVLGFPPELVTVLVLVNVVVPYEKLELGAT